MFFEICIIKCSRFTINFSADLQLNPAAATKYTEPWGGRGRDEKEEEKEKDEEGEE